MSIQANMDGRAAVVDRLAELRVAPVITIGSAEHAVPLADALLEGGLPVAEITFRTDAAADAIAAIRDQRPEVFLGAGTVLTTENLERAHACGARFAVAPGLNPAVVNRARELGMPFFPGVATPSEIEHGLSLGQDVLKFFPAATLGGPAALKAIVAPYEHTGVRIMPTGGVNGKNLGEYLAMKSVIAVGGTWIAKRHDLEDGAWNDITARCKVACHVVEEVQAKERS